MKGDGNNCQITVTQPFGWCILFSILSFSLIQSEILEVKILLFNFYPTTKKCGQANVVVNFPESFECCI